MEKQLLDRDRSSGAELARKHQQPMSGQATSRIIASEFGALPTLTDSNPGVKKDRTGPLDLNITTIGGEAIGASGGKDEEGFNTENPFRNINGVVVGNSETAPAKTSRKRKSGPNDSTQDERFFQDQSSLNVTVSSVVAEQPTAPSRRTRKRPLSRASSSLEGSAAEIAMSEDLESSKLDLEHKLTTIAGQLAANPKLSVDQARRAARREYNRRNAARARQRSKFLTEELQVACSTLAERVEDLIAENERLRAQVKELQARKERGKEAASLSKNKIKSSADW